MLALGTTAPDFSLVDVRTYCLEQLADAGVTEQP